MTIETCEKHDDCLGRIHDSIKHIEVSNAKTEGFMLTITNFTDSIRRDVYSKDGIMERCGRNGHQLALQWGLLATIVLGVFIAFALKK